MQLSEIFYRLKRFDAYPKPMEDFSVKTFGGAAITIVSGIIMVILFISELNYYLSAEIHQELFVDTTRGQKLNIEFSISIPRVPCHLMTTDAMDVSGEQTIDIAATLFKQRLDINGNPIKEAEEEKLGDKSEQVLDAFNKTLDPDRCESCYGAETSLKKCCNTCSDVRDSYRERGWVLKDLDNIAQCVRENFKNKISTMAKEGCHIHGSLLVNKVAGNFHIAPGKTFQQQHVHVHDLQELSGLTFNLSHKINKMAFGEDYPLRKNPLDNTEQAAAEGSMMYQYFLKIVPTMYQTREGQLIHSNQYSVTKYSKAVSTGFLSDQGLPGIFFLYELSPLMVKYEEKERSFLHFLTAVCAIIGGVFTVASLIDSFLYRSVRIIQKKIDLGKFS